ncbi:MAG: exo-alpha-sialidase [Isosphaeraceae bacterium]
MRSLSLLAVVFVGFGTAAFAVEEPTFQSVAVFPAERKHNHASCVIETANGDLLVAWYRGSGERTADDVEILGSWLTKGSVIWSPRFLLADTPGYPDCNPAIFAAPDKTIWLFYPTILDHRWEGALLKFAVARDTGQNSGPPTWIREGVLHITPTGFDKEMDRALESLSPELKERHKAALDKARAQSKDLLYQRLGWMPRVHPTVLPSGRWLLPLYTDTFSVSIVLSSDDQGATWATSGPMIGFGNIQPSLVRKENGELVSFMRDNGPFRRIRLSTSRDEGKTWGPVTSSELPNPGAGVEAIRLANGHWALVYNDLPRGRHSLAVSISDDEGKTWRWTRHIEVQPSGQGSFHYPSIMQARDGSIHVTYTHSSGAEGSTIQHARFNEAWVAQGDPAR